MRIRTALKALGATLLATLAAQQTLAWDGIVHGKIVGVEVNGQVTRILFENQSIACNNGKPYFFVSTGDANYFVYVSTALTAMAQKTPVTAYSWFSSYDGGTCHIGTLVSGSSSHG